MKQVLEDYTLKNMAVPTIEHSAYRARLRHVLVSGAADRADQKQLIPQGVERIMKAKTIFTAAGAVGVLAVGVLAFSALTLPQSVSAQEVAQQSSRALAGMSTPQSDYQKHYPLFVEWMSQAQRASDLRLLSYDQFSRAYPEALQRSPVNGEPLRVVDNPADGQQPNLRELRYLEFTVTDGDVVFKVVVGVNSHNIPEAALKYIIKSGSPRVGA